MCLKARGLIARNGRHSVSIKSWAIPICQKALNPPLHSLPFSLLTDTGNMSGTGCLLFILETSSAYCIPC